MKQSKSFLILILIGLIFIGSPFSYAEESNELEKSNCVVELEKTSKSIAKAKSLIRKLGEKVSDKVSLLKEPAVNEEAFRGGLFHKENIKSEMSLRRGYQHTVQLFPRLLAKWMVRDFDFNYKFTPLRAISRNLLDRPTEWVTETWGQSKKQLTLWAKVPIFLVAFTLAYDNFVTDPLDEAIKAEFNQNVEMHKDEINTLIASDFRYKPIKEEVLKNEDFKILAVQSAYAFRSMFNSYYDLIASIDEPLTVKEELKMFGDHEAFSLVTDFLRKHSQTDVNDPDEALVINQSFKITHMLYYNYLFLDQFFVSDSIVDDYKKTSSTYTLWAQFREDPFVQELMSAYASEVLSKSELKYLLQQDFYYQHRFQLMMQIGETFEDDDGTELTIHEIRQSILNDIQVQRK